VWLSLHGSYFMNFCGKKEILEASKQRLVACATAAAWMKAHVVVFHPGFYGERTPKQALDICRRALQDTVQTIQSQGINHVSIGPETMGRLHQLGSLDEILELCESVEQTQVVTPARQRSGTVSNGRRFSKNRGDRGTATRDRSDQKHALSLCQNRIWEEGRETPSHVGGNTLRT